MDPSLFANVRLKNVETRVRNQDGSVRIETVATGTETTTSPSSTGDGGEGSGWMVVDTSPDTELAPVLPGQLYVGSQDAAANKDGLEAAGIGLVINVGVGIPCFFPDAFEYLDLDVLDVPEFDIGPVLDETSAAISASLENDVPVFVHCNAGVSRSVTVVAHFLISHHSLSLETALATIKSVRPSARPNDGFLHHLSTLTIHPSIHPSKP